MATRVQPVRNAIRRRLIAAAEEKGIPKKQAEQALTEMEAQRPLIDWLKNGGIEELVELFLKLLALFATPERSADQPAGADSPGAA